VCRNLCTAHGVCLLVRHSPCIGLSILFEVNHRRERRVREIRLHGSEGGGAELNRPFLPLLNLRPVRCEDDADLGPAQWWLEFGLGAPAGNRTQSLFMFLFALFFFF
jgi:hypothetical protein